MSNHKPTTSIRHAVKLGLLLGPRITAVERTANRIHDLLNNKFSVELLRAEFNGDTNTAEALIRLLAELRKEEEV